MSDPDTWVTERTLLWGFHCQGLRFLLLVPATIGSWRGLQPIKAGALWACREAWARPAPSTAVRFGLSRR